MNTKAFFPCGGGSNLILGTHMENLIFFLRTPATIKFFSPNSQKLSLVSKKNHYPTRWICMTYIWTPTLFPGGYYNFPRSTNKIQFFDEISTSEKIC